MQRAGFDFGVVTGRSAPRRASRPALEPVAGEQNRLQSGRVAMSVATLGSILFRGQAPLGRPRAGAARLATTLDISGTAARPSLRSAPLVAVPT